MVKLKTLKKKIFNLGKKKISKQLLIDKPNFIYILGDRYEALIFGICAKLLNINLKGKYDGLADATNNLFREYVSSNAVALDDELRKKSTEAFNALAWGFLEGSK